MPNPVYKIYKFDVTAADKGRLLSAERTTFELDANVVTVTGIALSANNRGTLFDYGTNRLEISGKEIFPAGYPSHMLMSGVTVPPAQKYYRFPEPLAAGTRRMVLEFTDTWVAPATGMADDWRPYTVQVMVEQTVR